jgi:2-methylcitrate dehydratase PrpD
MAAGLMAAQEGAMVKRLHAGRAAQSGVQAALLAQKGFTGITDVLEAGYGGFLSSLSGNPNPERLTAGLGSIWETREVGFKLFPSVTSIHTALDALDHIMRQHNLTASQIEKIEVGCSHMTHVHTAWPYKPAGVTAAQMNLFFGLAIIALFRDGSVRQYTQDSIDDPTILAFLPRLTAHVDSDIEAKGPAFRHAARVAVTTKDGRTLRHECLGRRGSPDDPVGADAIEQKFDANIDGILTRQTADDLKDLIFRLDQQDNASNIIDRLRN